MRRALLDVLLVSLLALGGCGGSVSESNDSTSAAPSVSIRVSPTTTITTDESGGADIISVRLGSKPTADVTIPVTSSNPKEGTANTASLLFTGENWSTAQDIIVTGVEDDNNDGNQSYTIHLGTAVSEDSAYRALEKTLSAINLDIRKGSFIVSPGSGVTTEGGGSFTFSVSLGYAPSAEVRLPITGVPTQGSLNKSELIFTTLDWKTPQEVTVTGLGDTSPGDHEYTIQLGPADSTDKVYANLEPGTVRVTNQNTQQGDFSVTPSGAFTDESGGQVTIAVKLLFRPAFPVSMPVECSNPQEATVSTNLLTFTADNWDLPQTITVTGIEDPVVDNNTAYSIKLGLTSSDDDNFNGLDPVDVSLTNLDVKTGEVKAAPLTLVTSEAGTGNTAAFQVTLTTAPFYNVTVPVKSLDTGEGTVDKSSLNFTNANWNRPQTVTVTGVADDLADGNVIYAIELGVTVSNDDNYSSLNPVDVSVTNQDSRLAKFIVEPTSIVTDESGKTADFSVSLGTQPAADVTIEVSSSDTSEGTVSTNLLTFTKTNWATPQKVTVTGVSDIFADGTQPYTIVLAAAGSTDPAYNLADPPDVDALNGDTKVGKVTVSTISGNTDESGQTATFTVSLSGVKPEKDVTMAITSSRPLEGTVPATLVFEPADWNAIAAKSTKTVTVTGVDDTVDDGNQDYLIILGLTSSSDYNFDGISSNDVSVTNVDLVEPYGVEPRISAGYYHNLVLAGDGTVWGWGACVDGQLDAVAPATCSETGNYILPQRLKISKASSVSAGNSFSVIVTADGTVSACGKNDYFQLGRVSGISGSSLDKVKDLSGVTAVSAGDLHVLAIKNNTEVWAWGANNYGQLGNVNPDPTIILLKAAGALTNLGNTIIAVAAGIDHSLALDHLGNIYSWGSDAQEQLGLGVAIDNTTSSPTAIPNPSDVTAIAAGHQYSLAVDVTNAWGWGSNSDFQLGTGTGPTTPASPTDPTPAPAVVNTFNDTFPNALPTRLDGGYLHSIALASVGGVNKVYTWGDNENTDNTEIEGGTSGWDNRGALGTKDITDYQVPTLAFTDIPVTATDVSAGYNYSLVLLGDGRIQSSGMNNFGQLGTNEIDTGSFFTSTPLFVEDPADTVKGTSLYPFYAYRPVLSGQPATSTTNTSVKITVCEPYGGQPADYCKGITHYAYKLTGPGTYIISDDSSPIADKIVRDGLPTGAYTLLVKGMKGPNNPADLIQTDTSAVKVSWTVVAP